MSTELFNIWQEAIKEVCELEGKNPNDIIENKISNNLNISSNSQTTIKHSKKVNKKK